MTEDGGLSFGHRDLVAVFERVGPWSGQHVLLSQPLPQAGWLTIHLLSQYHILLRTDWLKFSSHL